MENIKIERLTNGPKHHLFGFHDLLITNKMVINICRLRLIQLTDRLYPAKNSVLVMSKTVNI